jgi:hypothetical protein
MDGLLMAKPNSICARIAPLSCELRGENKKQLEEQLKSTGQSGSNSLRSRPSMSVSSSWYRWQSGILDEVNACAPFVLR